MRNVDRWEIPWSTWRPLWEGREDRWNAETMLELLPNPEVGAFMMHDSEGNVDQIFRIEIKVFTSSIGDRKGCFVRMGRGVMHWNVGSLDGVMNLLFTASEIV